MVNNPPEWQSVFKASGEISVEKARAILNDKGTLAYTDGGDS
ncbi:MAG: hypothetical protein ABI456_24000 [Ktedonobacteraceae bacterium]